MFKPKARFKRLLAEYDTRVWIFTDGLFIIEKQHVKIAKRETKEIDVWHYFPVSIRMSSTLYKADDARDADHKLGHVITRGHFLVHGLEAIRVYLNSQSPNARARGISMNTVEFCLPDGGIARDSWIPNAISSWSTVFPDPTDHLPRSTSDYLYSAAAFYAENRHSVYFTWLTYTPEETQKHLGATE